MKINIILLIKIVLILFLFSSLIDNAAAKNFCDIWNVDGKCDIHSGILFDERITDWSNAYNSPEIDEYQRAAIFLDQQGIDTINIVAHVSGGRWWDLQIKEFLNSIESTGVDLKVILDLEPDYTWSQQDVIDNIETTINIAKKVDNTLYPSVIGISLDMEYLGGTGRGTDTLNKIREEVVISNSPLIFFPIWFNEVSKEDLNGMSNKDSVIPLYDGLVTINTPTERDGSNIYINNMVNFMKNNGFASIGVMPISDSPNGASLKQKQSTAYKTWFAYKEAFNNAGGVDYFFLGSGDAGENPLSIYLLLGTPVVYPVIDDNPEDDLHWGVPYNYFGNWYPTMNGFHPGEDWNLIGGDASADLNEPVYAIADGKVVKVYNAGTLGYLVAIEHNALPGHMFIIPGKEGSNYNYETEYVTKIYSVYIHINKADGISEGTNVRKGETIIGHIMNPGGGPHLHFEIRHPEAENSASWTLVGNSNNWVYSDGKPNGYYRNAQIMVDAGVRDPRDFIKSNSIFAGIQYLRTVQNPDGSWTGSRGTNVGYTSLGVLPLLNNDISESDPVVAKAIDNIRSNRKIDGSIYVWYSNYETSLAILSLVATHNSAYESDILAARNFIADIQNDEGELLTNSDWTYGGWGYNENSPSWSDLSNTQWSLMGLDAAGLSTTDNTWSKAETYITRSQNWQATNPVYDVTNDGGFTYQPPSISCCWGGGGDTSQSYGAMTAAGVWSLRLTGVDTTDQRVQAGLNWLRDHYVPIETVQNPGIGNTYLYYYLLSFAKSLIMTEIPAGSWQETASNDITNYIVSEQNDDGHWTSAEGDLFATEQAILALQTRTIPTNIQRLSYFSFILHSNADLHIYDPLGRHVGMNYETGEIEIEIPGATYTSNDDQEIHIQGLEPGNYRIVLVGTGDGEFTLDVRGGVGDTVVSEDSFTSSISDGEIHEGNVNVAMITWLTINIEELNALPIADANGPYTGIVNSLIIFDGTQSYDPDGTIVSYEWDLDDDGEFDDAIGQIPTKIWDTPYSGTISLKVTDNNGATDVDSTSLTVEQIIPATVDFDPDTLNLKSNGNWITVYIELPESYGVRNIDVNTVMLNDIVQAEETPTDIGDYDEDNVVDLMVKFDNSAVQDILEVGDEIIITITGELTNGIPFEGTDTIRVSE